MENRCQELAIYQPFLICFFSGNRSKLAARDLFQGERSVHIGVAQASAISFFLIEEGYAAILLLHHGAVGTEIGGHLEGAAPVLSKTLGSVVVTLR